MNLRSLPVVAVAGAFILAACASDDASHAIQAPAATAATGAVFNDADVTFAQGMVPHHEQAIEMADIALDPRVGASEQVRDLAARIKSGQGPEIKLMTDWLTAWGQPLEADTGASHDMSSTDGMMPAEGMDALGTIAGADFDRMWMEMMVRHHQGAIAMAETVKAAGSSPDVLALADQVIIAQQAEITEMRSLRRLHAP